MLLINPGMRKESMPVLHAATSRCQVLLQVLMHSMPGADVFFSVWKPIGEFLLDVFLSVLEMSSSCRFWN